MTIFTTTIWLSTFGKSRCPVTITGDAYADLVMQQAFKTCLGISIKNIARQIRDDSMNGLFFSSMHIDHDGCNIQVGVSKAFPRFRDAPFDILNQIVANPSRVTGLVQLDGVDAAHRVSVQIGEKGVPAIVCGIRFHEGADFIAMVRESEIRHQEHMQERM